ncbi:MAG: hypothetical protein GX605_07275 [Chloroflexi bacterium]|nr:hypothetical protein [Chloroflexota bacterium]
MVWPRVGPRLGHPAPWACRRVGPAGEPPVDREADAQFAAAVASCYRGRVFAYILWNEPDLALEWAGRPPDP